MKTVGVEHPLQRTILRDLSSAERLRFSELCPAGVENNVFTYHLQQLIKMGLVCKQERSYALTDAGLMHVARVTRSRLGPRVQPTLFSFLILMNEHDEVALLRRPQQPFMGRWTFPGEIVQFGERLEVHHQRLLHDKVGVEAPLELRGLADSMLTQDGRMITHVHAQLFYGRVSGQPPIRAVEPRFAPQWVALNSLSPAELLPDVRPILARLAQDEQYFYLPLTHEVSGV